MLAIIIFTAISLFAFRASEQKQAERSAANSAAAWQQVGRVSTAANSIDAFATTWSAQHADGANSANGAGQRTLSWRVRDARDLRSSLLALDATKAPVQRIDIVRRDASFTVVAEVAP